jgi:hypothetical protein
MDNYTRTLLTSPETFDIRIALRPEALLLSVPVEHYIADNAKRVFEFNSVHNGTSLYWTAGCYLDWFKK